MKAIIPFIIFLFFYATSFGQGIPTFERYTNSYYTQYASDIAELQNGNFLLTGEDREGLVLNTDVNAKQNWIKQYRLQSANFLRFEKLLSTGNSAYILGNKDGIILLKVDSIGSVSWAKKINRSTATVANSFIKTYDNNLLISAYDSARVLLIKCDTLGNVIWSKHYFSGFTTGTNGWQPNISSVLELPDHSLVTIAAVNEMVTANFEVHPHTLILKTDAGGNITWSKKLYYYVPPFTVLGSLYVYGNNIFHTSDNGFIITYFEGMDGSFGGSSTSLAKLDSSGNLIFAAQPFTQAEVVSVSEYPIGTINIAQLGGFTGDVVFPIYPLLIKANLSLTVSQVTEYRSPIFVPQNWNNFAFRTAKQLSDKRFAFIGSSEAGLGPSSGISILLTDSAGHEGCTERTPVFNFIEDTLKEITPVTLQTDTGINIVAINVSDSLVQFKNCNCDSMPTANFGYSITGNTVSFFDSSQGVTNYYWSFGDNTHDTLANPIHSYTDSLHHSITLMTSNNCGYAIKYITIDTVSIPTSIAYQAQLFDKHFTVFPNPTNDFIQISPSLDKSNIVSISNILGQVVLRTKYNDRIPVSELKSGLYFLQVYQDGLFHTKPFIIE